MRWPRTPPGTANSAAIVGPGAICSPARRTDSCHTEVRNSTLPSRKAPNALKHSGAPRFASAIARVRTITGSIRGAGWRVERTATATSSTAESANSPITRPPDQSHVGPSTMPSVGAAIPAVKRTAPSVSERAPASSRTSRSSLEAAKKAAKVIAYAFRTQDRPARPTPVKSRRMSGKAMLTMNRSSEAMKTPTRTVSVTLARLDISDLSSQ